LNWKLWLGIVISAIFLLLALRKVDFHELGNALQSAEYIYLLPASFLSILSLWIRAYRWHYLLEHIRPIKMSSLFSATMIGFMANNLFPARFGEFVRAWAIGEKEGIRKSASFATIVLERILDGITVLLFLAIIVIFWRFPFPNWLKNAAYGSLGIYFFALLFLIVLKGQTERSIKLAQSVSRPLPDKVKSRFLRIMESFIEGLGILHSMKDITGTVHIRIVDFVQYSSPNFLCFSADGDSLPRCDDSFGSGIHWNGTISQCCWFRLVRNS